MTYSLDFINSNDFKNCSATKDLLGLCTLWNDPQNLLIFLSISLVLTILKINCPSFLDIIKNAMPCFQLDVRL